MRAVVVARRLAAAGLWLVLAALFALGAAGLVTGFGGAPATPKRAELTWAGDQAAEPGLQAAATDLRAVADDVASLSTSARTALAAVVAPDMTLLSSSVDAGSTQVDSIAAAAAKLQAEITALPGVERTADGLFGPTGELRLGPQTRARIATLETAVSATLTLPADWTKFSGASLAAQRLTTLLVDHDAATAAAAALGVDQKYAAAVAALDKPDSLLAEAKTLRGRIANTVDVSTLDEWIRRNGDYDAALRTLYSALVASGGKVDDTVRAAFAKEQAARDQLPPDTRGLVIILSEIARGGMNEVAIGIEQAKARLDDAVDAVAGASASADGADSPGPPGSPSPAVSAAPS